MTREARQDPDTPSRYHDLEALAAIAVTASMSHAIFIKASNVDRDRINALLLHHADELRQVAEERRYERHPSGVITRAS